MWGERSGIDANFISNGRQRARDVAAACSYHPRDVFNIDETGLFFRMTPDRSLSTAKYTKGTKKIKQRNCYYIIKYVLYYCKYHVYIIVNIMFHIDC